LPACDVTRGEERAAGAEDPRSAIRELFASGIYFHRLLTDAQKYEIFFSGSAFEEKWRREQQWKSPLNGPAGRQT
jgi:hypothetical protein